MYIVFESNEHNDHYTYFALNFVFGRGLKSCIDV